MRASVRVRAEHVVLCGTAGSGKSTVGSLVAKALGRAFVDIDREVEIEAGASVSEVFARDGEAAFRARERAAVRRALEREDACVIALGGGALEHDDTYDDVRQETLVWLHAPVATLAARIGASITRPLLAGDPLARLRELAARREARYRSAHITVNAAPTARNVAHAIVAELERRTGPVEQRA
jgi:shikimate kinase